MDCLVIIFLESGFHLVLNQTFFLNSWLRKLTGEFVLAQTLSQVQLGSFYNLCQLTFCGLLKHVTDQLCSPLPLNIILKQGEGGVSVKLF